MQNIYVLASRIDTRGLYATARSSCFQIERVEQMMWPNILSKSKMCPEAAEVGLSGGSHTKLSLRRLEFASRLKPSIRSFFSLTASVFPNITTFYLCLNLTKVMYTMCITTGCTKCEPLHQRAPQASTWDTKGPCQNVCMDGMRNSKV